MYCSASSSLSSLDFSLLPINYNFPPRYQHWSRVQRAGESSTWNSLLLSDLTQLFITTNLDATLKLAVIIVHAARTIALDDSPASGRWIASEARGSDWWCCIRTWCCTSEVQGYALAPVVLLTPLGCCCEKRIRRERERERAARTCSAGKATLFSFLSRKSIVKTRCIGWQTPDNTRASSDRRATLQQPAPCNSIPHTHTHTHAHVQIHARSRDRNAPVPFRSSSTYSVYLILILSSFDLSLSWLAFSSPRLINAHRVRAHNATLLSLLSTREETRTGLECDPRVQSVLIATLANHHDILEKTGASLGRWGPPSSFFLSCTLSVLYPVPRGHRCDPSIACHASMTVHREGEVPPRENRWGFVFQFCLPIRCTGWWVVARCSQVWVRFFEILFSRRDDDF